MNILLIIMDSVQAKNTSLHGHYNKTTPFLESFINSATFYRNARSPSYFSLPSHASIFTGLHAPEHGANSERSVLSNTTIFEELLNDYGYKTGLFTTNSYLTEPEFGLNKGFSDIFNIHGLKNMEYPFPDAHTPAKMKQNGDTVNKIDYLRSSLNNKQRIRSLINGISNKFDSSSLPVEFGLNISAENIAEGFLSWSNGQTKPWAACLNFMDTHYPYLPDSKHDRWSYDRLWEEQSKINNHRFDFLSGDKPFCLAKALEGLYDGTIHQVDQSIKRIYDALKRRGDLHNTLVIVTSDHGEGFGEPSRIIPQFPIIAHLAGLHETLLHVPLCIKFPSQNEKKAIEELASTRKIYDVIKETVVGDADWNTACPSKHVLSYADFSNRTALNNGQFSLDGKMRAVYNKETDHITKFIQYQNRTCSVKIKNAQESMLSDDDESSIIIDNAFENISGSTSKVADMDESTRQRLQELGYL